MKLTKSQLRKVIKETINKIINEASKDGVYQKKARQSFIELIKKLAKGPIKNTSPYTEKPTVGKSGPVGMP